MANHTAPATAPVGEPDRPPALTFPGLRDKPGTVIITRVGALETTGSAADWASARAAPVTVETRTVHPEPEAVKNCSLKTVVPPIRSCWRLVCVALGSVTVIRTRAVVVDTRLNRLSTALTVAE